MPEGGGSLILLPNVIGVESSNVQTRYWICASIKPQYSRSKHSRTHGQLYSKCVNGSLCLCCCESVAMLCCATLRAQLQSFLSLPIKLQMGLFVQCCKMGCSTSLCNGQFIGAGPFLVNGLLANNSLKQNFTRFNSSEDDDSYWYTDFVIHVRALVDNHTRHHQQNTHCYT
jgi:hypothetical protein